MCFYHHPLNPSSWKTTATVLFKLIFIFLPLFKNISYIKHMNTIYYKTKPPINPFNIKFL